MKNQYIILFQSDLTPFENSWKRINNSFISEKRAFFLVFTNFAARFF